MVNKVYVIPSKTNDRVIEQLKGKLRFKNLEFFKLSIEPKKIKHELSLLCDEPGAIMIWPDGYYHGYSYYFDHNSSNVKYNIDGHDDMETNPTASHYGMFASHMWNSGVRPTMNKVYSEIFGRNVVSVNDQRNRIYLKDYVIWESIDSKNVQLTIDLDSVIGFPADEEWRRDAFLTPDELMRKIEIMAKNTNIIRIDFGGIDTKVTESEFEFAYEIKSKLLAFAIENIKPPIKVDG